MPNWKQERKQSTVVHTKRRKRESCAKERGRPRRCKAIRKRANWLRKAQPKRKNRKPLDSKDRKVGLGATCSSLSKEWRGRNPYLKNLKVKSGGHVRFMQEERRRHTQICTRVSAKRPYATQEAGGVHGYSYVIRRRKIKTDERRQTDSTPKTLKRKAKKALC